MESFANGTIALGKYIARLLKWCILPVGGGDSAAVKQFDLKIK
jgi:3-phosphoglycerate kinase